MEEKADLGPLTDTVTSANKMRNLETVSGLAGIEASPRHYVMFWLFLSKKLPLEEY